MIAVGTCGYSYGDWKGTFYPATIRPAAMLEYYARVFTTVEIDSTYYRVPSLATFAGMAARTPPDFRFCIKLPKTATHVRLGDKHGLSSDVELLHRNIAPLVGAGKCLAVLMQFPNAFHPTPAARSHITQLRSALSDIALVAEFRHRAWQTSETLDFLHDLDIGWVNVDMPQYDSLLRPSADATSSIAYVRFHGRNDRQWWRGDNVSRYDYEYVAGELNPWVDRLIDLASNAEVREVLAFFNNHRRGQAARNAQMFEAMLQTRYPDAIRKVRNPPAQAEQLRFDICD